MPQPLKGFPRRLEKAKGNVKKLQNEIKREMALEALTAVVGDTPVRTGRARGGWVVGVGAPDLSQRQGAYTDTVGKGSSRGGDQSINEGRARIRSGKVKWGVPIYLNNNVSYILDLNRGSSTQAPSQFIQLAIARGIGIVRRQLRRYGKIFE